MEIFLLVVLLILVIIQGSRLSDKNRNLQKRLDELLNELHQVRADITAFRSAPPKEPVPPAVIKETPVPPIAPPVVPPIVPEPVKEPVKEWVPEKAPEPVLEEAPVESSPLAVATAEPAVPEEPRPSFIETFLKNNPDLEKFIGENLINKIGIAILVLGIGYFVKFAIDKDWINEIGRVSIGILAGGILIGLAHRLRNTFAAFSSVLVGGGLAVLYFTIAIAFHEYQLFSQTAAFLIMVLITGFSILLSILYNRVELAVLSILGGFATPFMVSTGEGNYQVLFTYILILNVGMLVLAYLRKWVIINWIAYIGTILLYGGWLSTRVVGIPDAPLTGALLFGTAFYLIFFLMNIINNVKEKTRFTASEISILLSNTFIYYSAGMTILSQVNSGAYQGLFTAAVAVFNFLFAFILYKNEKVDRNLIYLLIGLVVTFISLSIPVQLEGNHITMFWALEAVLLLWLAQKSGIQLVSVSAIVVTVLMLISLAMDWENIYTPDAVANPIPVLINKAFITSSIAILSLFATIWLLNRQTQPFHFYIFRLDVQTYRQSLILVLLVVIYLACLLELQYQLLTYLDSAYSRRIILGCYNLFVITLLAAWANRKRVFTVPVAALGILGLLLYLFLYNPVVLYLLQDYFVYGVGSLVGFYFHYLAFVLVVAMLYFMLRISLQNQNILDVYIPAATRKILWPFCFLLVFIISSELVYHVMYISFSGTALPDPDNYTMQDAAYTRWHALFTQTNKIGFPILWGICAFVLMFIGLNRKNKSLRIIALSLFTLTLLKLFLYDIRGISEGGKIAAFISLGVLLLVISFMYQNIKRLILSDDAAKTTENT